MTVGEFAREKLRITNSEDGDVPLSVEVVSIVGSDSDAFSTNYSGGSFALAPGESRTFAVTLSPESPGQKKKTASDSPGGIERFDATRCFCSRVRIP